MTDAGFQLRPYAQEDWAAVCEVYDLAKPDELRRIVDPSHILPLAADEKMKGLFAASRVLVAEAGGRVVGFAGHRESFVTWLFVHPAFRRKGIGRSLMRHLIADLYPPIKLNVASDNLAAQGLYRQLGFTVDREYVGEFQGRPCSVTRLRYESP